MQLFKQVLQVAVVFALLVSATACVSTQSKQASWQTLDGKPPVVIAHRGDSGAFPEHTLAAYRSALEKGADFIEPDIVLTRDGVPICRHDFELEKSTNIATNDQFANRGEKSWLITEFSLAEINELQAIQPAKGRDQSLNGKYSVPTLSELFDLVYDYNQTHGTSVGLLIEIKSPDKHRAVGLDVSKASHDVIQGKVAKGKQLPIVFQCFDQGECSRIAGWGDYRVHWLSSQEFDMDDLPEGIDGLGLKKSLIKLKDGRSPLIDAAHWRGLRVHAWTFRDDRLPRGVNPQSPEEEMFVYLRAGLDGVITDFPATGVAARKALADEEQAKLKSDDPISQRVRKKSPRRLIKRQ